MSEHRFEDLQGGTDTPKRHRKYFEYRARGGGYVDAYLKGKASLHCHLIGLPKRLGERGLESTGRDVCIVTERAHPRVHTQQLIAGWDRNGRLSLPREAVPYGMNDPVLVDVVHIAEPFQRGGKRSEAAHTPDGMRSPDRWIRLIKGLQFLESCQVAAERRFAAQLHNRLTEVALSVKPRGVGVDGKLQPGHGSRVLASDMGPELDDKVVESRPSVMNDIPDAQAPLGIGDLWQIDDVKHVLTRVRVDIDSDAVIVSLLEGLDLPPQNLVVGFGPPEFRP